MIFELRPGERIVRLLDERGRVAALWRVRGAGPQAIKHEGKRYVPVGGDYVLARAVL